MTPVKQCDLCGKQYDYNTQHAVIAVKRIDVFKDSVETMELCPNCTDAFNDFIFEIKDGGNNNAYN